MGERDAISRVGPHGYSHGWIRAADAGALHGRVVTGRDKRGTEHTGRFDHPTRTVIPRGKAPVPVRHVRQMRVAPGHRVAEHHGPGPHPAAIEDTLALRRTAQTATASTVPEQIGRPGGPGLWKHQTWQLPPYIQHVAHDLEESGHPESEAVRMAVGIVENWAAGHDGHGHPVHPDVQAAAVKNIAQWRALQARTRHGARRSELRSTPMSDASRAAMATSAINDLPDDAFAYIKPGGTKDSSGKTVPRDNRFLPLHDAAHVRDALSRLPQTDIPDAAKAQAQTKIEAAAKKFGIKVADGGGGNGSSASRARELVRYYPLEECKILGRSDGERSGRVVEAYAAVWDKPAEIHDHEGHYLEEIQRTAFDEVLRQIHPDRNNGYWRVTCLFNHGMTVHGTPAERFSLPAGVTRYIGAEGQGLLTRTEYAETPLGDELLELVNIGALRSQSFTGGIVRSNPPLRGPGDRYRRQPGGVLQLVRRMVLGLREYGLTPFPAYSGAEVLGVRMQLPPGYEAGGDDGDADAYTPDDSEEEFEGDGSGSPPVEGDASRSTGNRLYRLRTEELMAKAGITLPSREE